MKKTISIAASLLVALSGMAQTINVHKTDGTVVKYSSSQVEYIDFSESSAPAGASAVDLGLPSGLKWANMNVGATTPEDYGDYFAWGETTAKSEYTWDTYKWGTSSSALTKYTSTDGKTALDAEDDAARANWGGSWRMPTLDEVKELLANTTNEWTTQNGVKGRKFTSTKNGNSIFLPASGIRYGTSLFDAGEYGNYWSSSLYSDNPAGACRLYFNSGNADWTNSFRYFGQSVRPVCP